MRRRRPPPPPSPALGTPALGALVDLLTLLLVVLLRTWSTEPPLDLPEPAVLPVSRSEAPSGPGVRVDIGPRGLYVEGRRAGSSRAPAADGPGIEELTAALQARGGTRVLLRADAATPWPLLQKVMRSAQQAGYTEVELVAVSAASL